MPTDCIQHLSRVFVPQRDENVRIEIIEEDISHSAGMNPQMTRTGQTSGVIDMNTVDFGPPDIKGGLEPCDPVDMGARFNPHLQRDLWPI
ncbi:hypothetical protein GCM10011363_27110 [Marivita lacus]|uniref:Uncharacterized protein n=1 Tax=Marivita lacus TaxID=1323742 RepID=A0ABQ1KVQ4_9RHOB|nr:hypothetical protein GCM10011363_27110 [Marivita lacus]